MRSLARRIRRYVVRLLGRGDGRAGERPAAPPLTESQMLSGILVAGAGDLGWPDVDDPDELDLIGVLIGVEGWTRMRQFAAVEAVLPYLGDEPEPVPEHSLDRLDIATALVRIGWDEEGSDDDGHQRRRTHA